MNNHIAASASPLKPAIQGMLDRITQKIVPAIHPKKIIFFGSHAWGNPSVDSDVDLLVIVNASDEPGYRRVRLVYAALRGVVVPIDLIVKMQEEVEHCVNVVTSLTKKVLKEGRVLYG